MPPHGGRPIPHLRPAACVEAGAGHRSSTGYRRRPPEAAARACRRACARGRLGRRPADDRLRRLGPGRRGSDSGGALVSRGLRPAGGRSAESSSRGRCLVAQAPRWGSCGRLRRATVRRHVQAPPSEPGPGLPHLRTPSPSHMRSRCAGPRAARPEGARPYGRNRPAPLPVPGGPSGDTLPGVAVEGAESMPGAVPSARPHPPPPGARLSARPC